MKYAIIALTSSAILIGALFFFTTRPPQQSFVEKVRIGGPFSLIDQHGRTITEQALRGKPTLIFFGFTHCPEICPTTLHAMTKLLETLESDADKVNVVFISVDPERDTPQQLAAYLDAFDNRIIGLTGSLEDITATARSFRIYYRKVPLENGYYTVDHTTLIYLLDAYGTFIEPMDIKGDPARTLSRIRALL